MPIIDIALLLLRRFVAPALLSAVALTAVTFLLVGLGEGPRFWPADPGRAYDVAGGLTWVFLFFTTPAILVLGIPIGYLVARLRLGVVRSLFLLVAIGAVSGVLIMMVIVGVPPSELGTSVSGLLMLGALPGSISALVWGLCNLDLYRRPRSDRR